MFDVLCFSHFVSLQYCVRRISVILNKMLYNSDSLLYSCIQLINLHWMILFVVVSTETQNMKCSNRAWQVKYFEKGSHRKIIDEILDVGFYGTNKPK